MDDGSTDPAGGGPVDDARSALDNLKSLADTTAGLNRYNIDKVMELFSAALFEIPSSLKNLAAWYDENAYRAVGRPGPWAANANVHAAANLLRTAAKTTEAAIEAIDRAWEHLDTVVFVSRGPDIEEDISMSAGSSNTPSAEGREPSADRDAFRGQRREQAESIRPDTKGATTMGEYIDPPADYAQDVARAAQQLSTRIGDADGLEDAAPVLASLAETMQELSGTLAAIAVLQQNSSSKDASANSEAVVREGAVDFLARASIFTAKAGMNVAGARECVRDIEAKVVTSQARTERLAPTTNCAGQGRTRPDPPLAI